MGQLFALKTFVRAGAIAVALGAASFAALPAQASPHGHYPHHGHFGHSYWPGHFGHGPGWYGGYWGYCPRPVPHAVCLTDRQVRNSLARRGYSNIALFSPRGLVVGAQARRGSSIYSLRINRCSGAILSVHRLRRG